MRWESAPHRSSPRASSWSWSLGSQAELRQMKVFRAARAVLLCGVLSLSLGGAGPAGLLLRVRKKYLEEELAKRLTSLGEDLTRLVEARKKQPHPPAGQTPRRHHFGRPPPPAPRMTVEVPHLPGAEITMRSSNSLDVHFKVLFGVYLEQPFDALSKEVQIQLRKNFTVLLSGGRNGFSIQGCSSCPDSLDVKTLYRASNTLMDDATPMVRMALSKDLVPVLDAHACALLESALSGPVGSLLSPGIFDLSPPGILYSLESVHVQGDNLLLELRGFCVLENVRPLLPVEISYEELDYLLVNLTIDGPARFALGSYGAHLNQPLKIEVSLIKKPSNSTWTFTDVYSVPVNVSVEDNKLKISMSPDSAFLHMEEENGQARDLVTVLEKVLEAELPPTWLDPVQKALPLPVAPGAGETVGLEVDLQEPVLLISVTPAADASQKPAGE